LSPPLPAAFAWVGMYIAFILGSNAVMHWRGPWDFAPWRTAPLFVSVCRILGVGVLGPIAEELLFRGAVFDRLSKSRLHIGVVIVLLAAIWAIMHVSYSGGVIALLFVAGILLGAARWQTGSVVTPIAMHIVWNLYAVW
jgi:membrane protease YdiL (CAAX protease family)